MIRLRGILLGVVFAAVAVGFAAAMPGAMSVSEVEETDTETSVEVREPKPEKTKSDEEQLEEDDSGDETREETHGSVVSAVAKCDVKGRWHGEAVRSIAQNPDATMADAEAACAAAIEAAEAAGGPGNSSEAKARPKGKPEGAGSTSSKAQKPDKPEKDTTQTTTEAPSEQPESSGSSSSGGSSGSGGPPPGKGKPEPRARPFFVEPLPLSGSQSSEKPFLSTWLSLSESEVEKNSPCPAREEVSRRGPSPLRFADGTMGACVPIWCGWSRSSPSWVA